MKRSGVFQRNIFTYQSFFVLQKNPVKYMGGKMCCEIHCKICGNSKGIQFLYILQRINSISFIDIVIWLTVYCIQLLHLCYFYLLFPIKLQTFFAMCLYITFTVYFRPLNVCCNHAIIYFPAEITFCVRRQMLSNILVNSDSQQNYILEAHLMLFSNQL